VYRAARVADAPACPAAAQLDGPFLVTNSLTKAWGLAGLRVGWAVADAETAERIRRMRDLVDVIGSFPAEQLGLRAFEQLDALTARTSAILREQWPLVATGLARCDAIDFVPPEGGMMVFPWFRDGRSADLFVDRLRREHDTLVVPGSFFEAASHFRLSFGGPREVVAKGLEHVVSVANSL
jgi:aspartate/methionine/tyrosine aminotransferase